MGIAVSIAILEIWNLLLSVTGSATALLFCFGILGWITNRSVLWNRLSLGLRTSRWLILLQIAVVLFLALRAVGPCIHYDTGLYGASAVQWILTYPTVLGLANLYGRLGFNSSAYLCLAALDTGVWKGLSFHLFTGYLMAAMCFTILPACVRVARRCPKSAADWFQCVLAIPLIFCVLRGQIVGAQNVHNRFRCHCLVFDTRASSFHQTGGAGDRRVHGLSYGPCIGRQRAHPFGDDRSRASRSGASEANSGLAQCSGGCSCGRLYPTL